MGVQNVRLGGVCPSGVIFFIPVRSLRSGRGGVFPGMEYGSWLTLDGFGQCRWVPWGRSQGRLEAGDRGLGGARRPAGGADAAGCFLGPLPSWDGSLPGTAPFLGPFPGGPCCCPIFAWFSADRSSVPGFSLRFLAVTIFLW